MNTKELKVKAEYSVTKQKMIKKYKMAEIFLAFCLPIG
jgi:hypothetical protein